MADGFEGGCSSRASGLKSNISYVKIPYLANLVPSIVDDFTASAGIEVVGHGAWMKQSQECWREINYAKKDIEQK